MYSLGSIICCHGYVFIRHDSHILNYLFYFLLKHTVTWGETYEKGATTKRTAALPHGRKKSQSCLVRNFVFWSLNNWKHSCFLLTYVSVISSMYIHKFVQKCHSYYTLMNQSVPLVIFPSVVSLPTKQLCLEKSKSGKVLLPTSHKKNPLDNLTEYLGIKFNIKQIISGLISVDLIITAPW